MICLGNMLGRRLGHVDRNAGVADQLDVVHSEADDNGHYFTSLKGLVFLGIVTMQKVIFIFLLVRVGISLL